jgi:hypothetical protein
MAKKKRSGKAAASPAPPAARPELPLVRRRDIRRYIYAVLDVLFAVFYFLVVTRLTLTQSAVDRFQLMTLPVFAGVMGAGMLIAGRAGWWMSVVGCGALLLSAVFVIARVLLSLSFLAGVYGGFGQAASMFALIAVALIVEVVVLLPLVQLRYLMSRQGRRTLGVARPLPASASGSA